MIVEILAYEVYSRLFYRNFGLQPLLGQDDLGKRIQLKHTVDGIN